MAHEITQEATVTVKDFAELMETYRKFPRIARDLVGLWETRKPLTPKQMKLLPHILWLRLAIHPSEKKGKKGFVSRMNLLRR